jgi:hypothetical protein
VFFSKEEGVGRNERKREREKERKSNREIDEEERAIEK